jgi:hypothetical protein
MANPNLVNVGTIRGQTAYLIPSATTVSTAWTFDGITSLPGLTPAVNTVNKVNSIMVSNVSGAAATITVAISNNATYASGTPYYLAFQIAVPVGATLIIVDKTTPLYVTENQSVGVIVGTASALNIVATFDVLT